MFVCLFACLLVCLFLCVSRGVVSCRVVSVSYRCRVGVALHRVAWRYASVSLFVLVSAPFFGGSGLFRAVFSPGISKPQEKYLESPISDLGRDQKWVCWVSTYFFGIFL